MLTHAQILGATVAVVYMQLALSGVYGSYCYDHQTETYDARFQPAVCTGTCTVTPFFSPDTSINTYVKLIKTAKESIDIYTPSLKSWTPDCTKNTDCPPHDSCTGCSIEQQKNESFPIFPALLNSVHEHDVKIRIITNNFTASACPGKIIPFDWLVLNKIQVRFQATTTFQHSKFIAIDKGTKTAISSVNWSYYSLLKNREAGVILEDCTCSAVTFYQSVFDYDWENGIDYVLTRKYSPSEIDIITDTAYMPYTIPNGSVPGAFVTQLIPHSHVEIKKMYTSPDHARDTLMTYLSNIQHSLNLAIYQVTDEGLCDELLHLHKRGINVTVLVSCFVIPPYNANKAKECYKNLTDGGMQGRVQCAYSKFRFSHEKYWIIDGDMVHLSTGNWSPSDLPSGSSWPPRRKSRKSINRDLEIAMEHSDLAAYFARVYNADWAMGKEWKPTDDTVV